MSELRYIYEEQPITEEMAALARAEQIDNARWEIIHREKQLAEARFNLSRLHEIPLPTTITVQHTLKPGDDGYENAPVRLDPSRYLGDFKWVNSVTSGGDCRAQPNQQ